MSSEYNIFNDGYGYLSAQFPQEYPAEQVETDITDSMLKKKIEAILKTLTLKEKIKLLSADGVMGQDTSAMTIDKSYGTGYWAGAARVGVPVIRCYDGPMGVIGNSGMETTRPSSEISLACTFDRELAQRYGMIYGRDNKASAGNMQLGIQTDLVRTLSTGRARDMFGEDWYLCGQIGSAMARGLENENVLACLKHVGGMGNLDEQTMMENQLSIYEQIFRIDNSAHSVMTNYGSTNGQQACADRFVLQDVFRKQWGWNGIVLTDWGGNYQFTVDKGVTIETPSDTFNNEEAVHRALDSGTLTEAEIDEAVAQNLYALGKIGYLGLVQISRDGTAATDPNPKEAIELEELTDPNRRRVLLDQNSQESLEIAQAGMVLLKNERNALPLCQNEKTVLMGPGAIHTVAGHMHECSFGRLKDLAVSPLDALQSELDDVTGYPVFDDLGSAIPGSYLYTDETLSVHGVHRVGMDGNGCSVDCIDESIDFTTKCANYRNGPEGNAFPYGNQGAQFTFKTWLKAPESGEYLLKVEAMAAAELNAWIDVDGDQKEIGAAGGKIVNGFFGTTGTVTSDTGLDIPEEPKASSFPFGPAETDRATEMLPPNMPPFLMKKTGEVLFQLEAGKAYPITISISGHIPEAYSYQIGMKDLQVRLAWVTPKEKQDNYLVPMEAISEGGKTVVLFVHELDALELEQRQQIMLTEAISNAKNAGNKIVLVLTTALPVDISRWEQDCDAILAAWLPGQMGGRAIANILTGRYNPSGRLCVTWPRQFDRDQASLNLNGRGVLQRAGHPGANVPTEIREGIFCGYKWYDAAGRTEDVLYQFGHGLSYTDFSERFEGVISRASGREDTGLDISVRVKNTGAASGNHIVLVYIEAPEKGMVLNAVYDPFTVADSFRYVGKDGKPTADMTNAGYFPQIDGIQFAQKQLCGFAKTGILSPGEETLVTIHISQRSLSYWNAQQEEFTVRQDGTKDKWVTVYGHRVFRLQNGEKMTAVVESADIEEAISATVPQQVIAGNVFPIQVIAPTDTVGIRALTCEGTQLPVFELEIHRMKKESQWELYTSLLAEGRYEILIEKKTWDGWQTPGIQISLDVLAAEPHILEFQATREVVKAGEQATFSVVTNSTAMGIRMYDEEAREIPVTELSRQILPSGNVRLILAINCSTPELGKILTACIGTEKVRTAISVL